MSQENVEVVRAMDEAFFGRTPEGAIEFFDPNVEVDATARPDGRIWHGHEGLRRAMIEWVETWEDWRANTERYIDVPPDQVIALWREQGRGRAAVF